MRLDILVKVAKYIKSKTNAKIRVNTNGTSDLIHGEKTSYLFKDCVDIVSISLNSYSSVTYDEICHPIYDNTFEGILSFAKDIKNYVPDVSFTVVDIIGKEAIEKCKKIANSVDIDLRVRQYI